MAEAFPEDLESSVEREVLETAPNAPIQWGRLIACLPQLDSIDLIQPSLKLGRCDECDIVIHKSKFLPKHLFFVSKEHFLITRDPDDNYITYITDLSKNGTYVNGELIGKDNKIILQNNNIIAIGEKLPVYIFKSMTYLVPGDYLPKILRKRYEPSYFLGIGACGEVRLVYDRLSCQKYAIKKIVKGKDTLSQIDRLNHPMRIQVEIDIMSTVLHPFVVRMHEIVSTELEVYLILEYVDGGELGRRIMGQNPLTESATKFLFYQLVLAVQYLHSRGITHRDLKPANVLLTTKDSMPVIKLSDFGLSKLSDGYDMMKTICGTWHFIAPEVLNPAVEEYGMQVDVWSLGITLFYMLSKELPFQARDRSTLGQLIINGTYNMSRPSWIEISPSAKDLVRRMLLVDPRQRITISGILNHPWIAQPSKSLIQEYMPICFKNSYPNTRVILDGTEIFIETPSDYVIQSSTYSVYKSHNTAKGVMGITHNGFVSFVTDLFPGRTSDRDFVIRSGLIENLDPGDSVMADRGFTIEEELRAVDCELNVPPFLEGVSQFNIENEQATRDIASIRIHVERKIREVKSYRILHSTVPNTLSDQLNKIWTDHLMQYQVDNLLVSFNYTGIRSKRATEEKGFLNQVKRIRLSSSSGEPSV